MAGKSTSESLQTVKERLLPVLKANWMLWPAAQVNSCMVCIRGKGDT